MSVDPTNDQPRLVSHCALLYAKLDAESDEENIWQGKIIDACTTLGISIGSYSRVVNALRKLGCIELLRKGYRSKPTMYQIHFPPTQEVWAQNSPERTEDLTSAPSSDTMAAQIKDMQKQLGGIILVDAMVNIEGRLGTLEQQMKELAGKDSTATS